MQKVTNKEIQKSIKPCKENPEQNKKLDHPK